MKNEKMKKGGWEGEKEKGKGKVEEGRVKGQKGSEKGQERREKGGREGKKSQKIRGDLEVDLLRQGAETSCVCVRTRLQSSATGFLMPDQRHFLSLYSYSLFLGQPNAP